MIPVKGVCLKYDIGERTCSLFNLFINLNFLNMRFPQLIFSGLLFITISSCSQSTDDSNCSASELSQKEQAMLDAQNLSISAQIAHAQDDSAENCMAYKKAYLEYLDKFTLWINCLDESTKEQWRPVYAQAEQKKQDIPC